MPAGSLASTSGMPKCNLVSCLTGSSHSQKNATCCHKQPYHQYCGIDNALSSTNIGAHIGAADFGKETITGSYAAMQDLVRAPIGNID